MSAAEDAMADRLKIVQPWERSRRNGNVAVPAGLTASPNLTDVDIHGFWKDHAGISYGPMTISCDGKLNVGHIDTGPHGRVRSKVTNIEWPGGASTPRAMAPPARGRYRSVIVHLQTRSRQGRVFCLHRSPGPSRGGGAPPGGGAMVPSGKALGNQFFYLEVDHGTHRPQSPAGRISPGAA